MPSVWESAVSAVVHAWSLSSDNIYCGKHLGLGHELLEMPVKIPHASTRLCPNLGTRYMYQCMGWGSGISPQHLVPIYPYNPGNNQVWRKAIVVQCLPTLNPNRLVQSIHYL